MPFCRVSPECMMPFGDPAPFPLPHPDMGLDSLSLLLDAQPNATVLKDSAVTSA